MKKVNEKGFTLAELLIVVAIIAVMVAIAIPTFGNQLEKAREATDLANFRAAYAEVMKESMDDPDNDHTASVTTKQTVEDWQSDNHEVAGTELDEKAAPATDAVEIKYAADGEGGGTVTIGGIEIASSFLSDSGSGSVKLKAAKVSGNDNSAENPFVIQASNATALTTTSIEDAVELENADGYTIDSYTAITNIGTDSNVALATNGNLSVVEGQNLADWAAKQITITVTAKKTDSPDKTLSCKVWISVDVA